jgi:hypothetical protein
MTSKMASPTDAAVPATGRRDDREDPRRRGGSRTRREEAPRGRGTGVRSSRTLTLEVAAREWMWLYDYRHGMSLAEIAGYEGLSIARVRFGVERSVAQESKLSKDDLLESLKSGRVDDVGFRLIPLFPIGAFTPQSACPHHDSIKRDSRLCCMVCHASGMDDHPGLRRDPKTDPSPEPRPKPDDDVAVSSESGKSKETRKQRRRRQLVEAAVA